jgi:hypothetical protein
MTSDEREAAIQRAGSLMERRYFDWAATSDPKALSEAHEAKELMRQLIAGRSAEAVAQMERERGLA